MASPAESNRKHLNARTRTTLIKAGKQIGRLTDAQKKTPSQKKSEAAKKKEMRRAGIKSVLPVQGGCDCHTCPKQPCGQTTDTCSERTVVHPCKKCGVKVRHYIDPDVPWVYCPPCKAEEGRNA